MSTKNNPGQFDCYANADPDEPMFVLLGRDKHAPTLVWLWALLRELDGEDSTKVSEARDCIASMLKWAAEHGKPSVGIGQAVLAGVLGLIQSANAGIATAPNAMTRDEEVQRFLSRTLFEAPATDPLRQETP